MRSTDGTFLMDNEHLCGGMVKDMCLEEHNCSSFLRFVGDAHNAGEGVELWKLWSIRGRSARQVPSLNPPIPCPLSSYIFSLGKQKRATY